MWGRPGWGLVDGGDPKEPAEEVGSHRDVRKPRERVGRFGDTVGTSGTSWDLRDPMETSGTLRDFRKPREMAGRVGDLMRTSQTSWGYQGPQGTSETPKDVRKPREMAGKVGVTMGAIGGAGLQGPRGTGGGTRRRGHFLHAHPDVARPDKISGADINSICQEVGDRGGWGRDTAATPPCHHSGVTTVPRPSTVLHPSTVPRPTAAGGATFPAGWR